MPRNVTNCAQISWLAIVGGLTLACSTVNSSAEDKFTAKESTNSSYIALPTGDDVRSNVVPTVALEIPPQVVSRPATETSDMQQSLLRQKLVERDRLQREIAELRAATNTPEQVLVRIKMMEVNRTKLKQTGIELSAVDSSDSKPLDLSSFLLGNRTARLTAPQTLPGASFVTFSHVTIQNPALAGMLDRLEQQGLARTIAAPAIVVLDGRPASLKVGGEFPVPPVADGGAAASKDFGTQCEVTATMLGENRVRLAIRPRVAEVDESQGIVVNGRTVPALSVREADFSCNVEFGRSILAVGLEQERRIKKSSWGFGQKEEVEQLALLIVAAPELIP